MLEGEEFSLTDVGFKDDDSPCEIKIKTVVDAMVL
jgi:hypothetical protein